MEILDQDHIEELVFRAILSENCDVRETMACQGRKNICIVIAKKYRVSSTRSKCICSSWLNFREVLIIF